MSTAVEPAVSVVIPVRNGGALLDEQLAALTGQDFTGSWEVLVVDNGSDDGSAERAQRYVDRLHLRVVPATDGAGPAYARNVGAAAARGKWFAFCDADDVVEPQWLRSLVEKSDEADLVGGSVDVQALNSTAMLQARGLQVKDDALPLGPGGFLPYAPSGNMLISRGTFHALGGWDEGLTHCEDVDLSWRAQLAGYVIAYQPDAVLQYRFRSSALGLFRQVANYSAAEPALYQRFRRYGVVKPTTRHGLSRLWWVLSRSPYVMLGMRRRHLWLAVCGEVVGHLRGSRRHRVLYL